MRKLKLKALIFLVALCQFGPPLLRAEQTDVAHARELGLEASQGDPTALSEILGLARGEFKSFNAKKAGMNETERGQFARQNFSPLLTAFDAVTDGAAKGNQAALDVISNAIHIPELEGPAVQSLGILAGKGNTWALHILLNPKDYHILVSGTIGALKSAAENGTQKAIDALAAVAPDQGKQALWFLVADGLGKAAASGNPVAIDALITLSADTNPSIRAAVISGLQRASTSHNANAAAALRKLNSQ
jgi:hypothetical protein